MYSDPIADMLTRIRNSYLARKELVSIPYSKLKHEIIKLLSKYDYLAGSKVSKDKKTIKVTLRYLKGKPAVTKLVRISKPGRRIYRQAEKLPYVLSGIGEAIMSTSQGILTAKESRKKGVGGEVICYIW